MSASTKDILDALARPFPADAVSWRVGQLAKPRDGEPAPKEGRALAYIDARDCEGRLDEVAGVNWTSRHEIHLLVEKGEVSVLCVCHLALLLETPAGWQWVSRSNGSGETDYEGQKGAMSKAFVRAASAWGVGRFLYALGSPKVKIQSFGKTHTIDRSEEPRLRGIVERALREYDANPRMRPLVHEGDDATPTQSPSQVFAPPEQPRPLLRKLVAIQEATKGEEALVALAAARQDRSVDGNASEDTFLQWLLGKIELTRTLEREQAEATLIKIESALARAGLMAARNKTARDAIVAARKVK